MSFLNQVQHAYFQYSNCAHKEEYLKWVWWLAGHNFKQFALFVHERPLFCAQLLNNSSVAFHVFDFWRSEFNKKIKDLRMSNWRNIYNWIDLHPESLIVALSKNHYVLLWQFILQDAVLNTSWPQNYSFLLREALDKNQSLYSIFFHWMFACPDYFVQFIEEDWQWSKSFISNLDQLCTAEFLEWIRQTHIHDFVWAELVKIATAKMNSFAPKKQSLTRKYSQKFKEKLLHTCSSRI